MVAFGIFAISAMRSEKQAADNEYYGDGDDGQS